MINDKIYEKIQQLLRMAEHEGSNENEAAVALKMAQKLLLENNLTRADIKTETETETGKTPDIGKIEINENSGYSWKSHLLGVLARHNLCRAILTPSDNKTFIFGSYENVKSVLEMYYWVVNELERMAIEQYEQYRNDGTGYENIRTWKSGFYLGATKTIGERLSDGMNEFTRNNNATALVIYNDKIVNDAVKKIFPHLTMRYSSTKSRDGYNSGRSAGSNVTLRPQRKLGGTRLLT